MKNLFVTLVALASLAVSVNAAGSQGAQRQTSRLNQPQARTLSLSDFKGKVQN